MRKVAAGRAFGVKLFCQNRQMRYDHESIPDRLWPELPTTASCVTLQGTCGNYATTEHRKTRGEREKEGE